MGHPHHLRRSPRVLAIVLGLLLTAPQLVQAALYSPWSAPVLETGVNSLAADGCPIESPDGLHLYLASNRDPLGGATDSNDIYVTERASIDAPFGPVVRLPEPVNSTAADFCPTPLHGNRLFFVSARAIPGACGAGDIYSTRNRPTRGWADPVNLGCAATGAGPNQAGGEFSPSLVDTREGTFLYYSSVGANGLQDIYVSAQQPGGTFAPGTPVAELNVPGFADQMPNIDRSGLEIVFVSDRPGGAGLFDIYVATRASTADPWSAPVNIAAVNTSAAESRPSLSGDHQRLHFGRSGDIWVSTRTKFISDD